MIHSVHLIGISELLRLPALGINLSVNNMSIIKTEYKTAGEAFTMAYKLITVEKKRARLYKQDGKWYVETTNQNNEQKGM